MATDRIYQVLWDIFENVNRQLQFAETKNAALTTLNAALVVAIVSIVASDDVGSSDIKTWLGVMATMFAGGGFLSFISFLPHLDGPDPTLKPGNWQSDANLIFFGHLSVAHPEDILVALDANDQFNSSTDRRLCLNLAHQIVVNSGIAARKFHSFKSAAIVTTLGGSIPTIVLVLIWAGNGGYFR